MSYFSSIYAADLPSRAVAVYMYLKDRSDKDGKSSNLYTVTLKKNKAIVHQGTSTPKRELWHGSW